MILIRTSVGAAGNCLAPFLDIKLFFRNLNLNCCRWLSGRGVDTYPNLLSSNLVYYRFIPSIQVYIGIIKKFKFFISIHWIIIKSLNFLANVFQVIRNTSRLGLNPRPLFQRGSPLPTYPNNIFGIS